MATNPNGTDPRFTQEVLTASATWVAGTTAKATLNDTANAVKLLTAGAYGALVKSLKAHPLATVTATRLLVMRRHSSDGASTANLTASALMAAQTLSATAAIAATAFPFDADEPLRLGPLEELWAGCSVTGVSVVFDAEYENF